MECRYVLSTFQVYTNRSYNISSVDNFKNTAGDIALSFNNAEIYTRIRDAGIRAGT